jgi:hypothetical protein
MMDPLLAPDDEELEDEDDDDPDDDDELEDEDDDDDEAPDDEDEPDDEEEPDEDEDDEPDEEFIGVALESPPPQPDSSNAGISRHVSAPSADRERRVITLCPLILTNCCAAQCTLHNPSDDSAHVPDCRAGRDSER